MKTVNNIRESSKVPFILHRYGWTKSAIIGPILTKLWIHKEARRRKVHSKEPLPWADKHSESETFKQIKRHRKCKIIDKEMQTLNWE
jgi:hypothetical protein